MKRVLVSGAGGYVGSIMCEELLKRNYEVYALDRFFFGLDKLSHIDDDNFSLDENTSQIGVYSAVELYFNFATSATDVTVGNDMILPAETLVFIAVPRGLGSTVVFNHLGKGSAGAVRIVEI